MLLANQTFSSSVPTWPTRYRLVSDLRAYQTYTYVGCAAQAVMYKSNSYFTRTHSTRILNIYSPVVSDNDRHIQSTSVIHASGRIQLQYLIQPILHESLLLPRGSKSANAAVMLNDGNMEKTKHWTIACHCQVMLRQGLHIWSKSLTQGFRKLAATQTQ